MPKSVYFDRSQYDYIPGQPNLKKILADNPEHENAAIVYLGGGQVIYQGHIYQFAGHTQPSRTLEQVINDFRAAHGGRLSY